MKRWFAWVLIFACFLTACTDKPNENQEQTQSTTLPKTTEPPHSILWADSAMEQATGGAVRVYGPDQAEVAGIGFLDGDPVALTVLEDTLVLTRFDSNTGIVEATGRYSCQPEKETVMFSGNRAVLYDRQNNCFRILDGSFKEIDKIKAPQTLAGTPIIAGDLSQAYFCDGDQIWALNLDTGIPRLVAQLNAQELYLSGLHFDGSVISCIVTDGDGQSYVAFLETATGITLGTDKDLLTVESGTDTYLLRRLDGTTMEVLLGRRDGQPNSFTGPESKLELTLLPRLQAVLAVESAQGSTRMGVYSLDTGKCLGSVTLDGVQRIGCAVEDPAEEALWFAAEDSGGEQDVLCRWDFGASGGQDETLRVGKRYSAGERDEDGILRCRELASQIGSKYGVDIRLADEVTVAQNYTFTLEYQVEAFEKALEDLDRAMAKFPEGFFRTMAKVTKDRTLHIGLIRAYRADTLNAQVMNDGLQYWIGGNAYIALSVGDNVEADFYNELSHAVDTYVYSYSIHYDFWNDCNPEGFVYDESYDLYTTHEGSPYLQDENRAFIDAFSMTFSHEDRARVMEYALMDGNEAYFQSDIMQAKLRQLCLGLRQAFGWKKYEGTFIWEQYLVESLAYTDEK